MLEQSSRRPVGMLDNERYAAYSVWCERRILPVVCVSEIVSMLVDLYCRYTGHVEQSSYCSQVSPCMSVCRAKTDKN